MKKIVLKNFKTWKRKGFTLAELLIVVAIIAVLVAVSIPIFTGRLEKARIATTEANIRSAKAAAIADWMDTGKANKEGLFAEFELLFSDELNIKVEAAHSGDSSKGDEGDSSASKKYVESGDYRTYGYDIGTNDLFAPATINTQGVPKTAGSSVYTKISVKINTKTGVITTSPYITGSGSNRTVNTGFGVNEFDSGTSPSSSGMPSITVPNELDEDDEEGGSGHSG